MAEWSENWPKGLDRVMMHDPMYCVEDLLTEAKVSCPYKGYMTSPMYAGCKSGMAAHSYKAAQIIRAIVEFYGGDVEPLPPCLPRIFRAVSTERFRENPRPI